MKCNVRHLSHAIKKFCVYFQHIELLLKYFCSISAAVVSRLVNNCIDAIKHCSVLRPLLEFLNFMQICLAWQPKPTVD